MWDAYSSTLQAHVTMQELQSAHRVTVLQTLSCCLPSSPACWILHLVSVIFGTDIYLNSMTRWAHSQWSNDIGWYIHVLTLAFLPTILGHYLGCHSSTAVLYTTYMQVQTLTLLMYSRAEKSILYYLHFWSSKRPCLFCLFLTELFKGRVHNCIHKHTHMGT